ncbi:MAG: hypothetical protein ACOYIE_08215 [Agathobaculum sp.]|uniref:hypothetical protein n=1 Tax=Eubacteriales TaxID=186802 RepID=UPI001898D5B1|nr:hypothetical protein [Anaerotruncus rubiinfantis]
MLCRPFRDVLTFIIFDGNFNLPQHLLVNLADHRAEGGNGLRGIEIEDTEEILMLKVVLRLQSASGHQGIGDAHSGGISERHSDVEIIILLKKRIFNDVKNIALVVVPIFIGKLGSDLFELIGKIAAARNVIIALQHGGHGVGMFRAVFPQVYIAGIVPAAGVGHIEHIAQSRLVAGGINDGNALAATAHITPHFFVPKIVFGAGGGFRALGINHELLIVGVFVEPCGGGQKVRPRHMTAGNLRCRVVGHLRVGL